MIDGWVCPVQSEVDVVGSTGREGEEREGEERDGEEREGEEREGEERESEGRVGSVGVVVEIVGRVGYRMVRKKKLKLILVEDLQCSILWRWWVLTEMRMEGLEGLESCLVIR